MTVTGPLLLPSLSRTQTGIKSFHSSCFELSASARCAHLTQTTDWIETNGAAYPAMIRMSCGIGRILLLSPLPIAREIAEKIDSTATAVGGALPAFIESFGAVDIVLHTKRVVKPIITGMKHNPRTIIQTTNERGAVQEQRVNESLMIEVSIDARDRGHFGSGCGGSVYVVSCLDLTVTIVRFESISTSDAQP